MMDQKVVSLKQDCPMSYDEWLDELGEFMTDECEYEEYVKDWFEMRESSK